MSNLMFQRERDSITLLHLQERRTCGSVRRSTEADLHPQPLRNIVLFLLLKEEKHFKLPQTTLKLTQTRSNYLKTISNYLKLPTSYF